MTELSPMVIGWLRTASRQPRAYSAPRSSRRTCGAHQQPLARVLSFCWHSLSIPIEAPAKVRGGVQQNDRTPADGQATTGTTTLSLASVPKLSPGCGKRARPPQRKPCCCVGWRWPPLATSPLSLSNSLLFMPRCSVEANMTVLPMAAAGGDKVGLVGDGGGR